ncbi:MAG: tRNA preQ1(34) S-adenosylmethionine ribosyltransferase-isomerase QueA [bacterium]
MQNSGLRTSDFDYHLPQELIAQRPADRRDFSRLMVIHKKSGKIEHRIFNQITNYIKPDDLLVLNDAKVIPARLYGIKYGGPPEAVPTGRQAGKRVGIEVLLNKKIDESTWEALIRPAKRLNVGGVIEFGGGFYAEVRDKFEDGMAALYFASVEGFDKELAKHGNIPLPPYIKYSGNGLAQRYQTVYAQKRGATAAPTAGLHFTKELLKAIKAKKTYVTLYTGYGTFAPVRTERVVDHKMHSESYEISKGSLALIRSAKADGGRVIAVGTTSARLLESVSRPGIGATDLFIYPGRKFKAVDAMITNFHLPKSTLMMLVSAFAGTDLIKKAYKEAVREKYGFFSFGDAMLIL